MRLILIIMSMFIIFTNSNDIKSTNSCMKIQINNFKYLYPEGNNQRGAFYSANIDLINNTDSIISFWIMDCSWQWNFITNKRKMGLDYDGCYYNQQIIRKIDPSQKLTYNAIFFLSDTLKAINKFKLGFILIKENELVVRPEIDSFPDLLDLVKYKIKKKKDIIWSENININQ